MAASRDSRKRRKKAEQQQKPVWLTDEQRMVVNKMASWTPPGYSVDHIVPLLGITVSGLNVPWNLQIVPTKENCSKGNRWPTDLLWDIKDLKALFGYHMKYLRIGAPRGCFTGAKK